MFMIPFAGYNLRKIHLYPPNPSAGGLWESLSGGSSSTFPIPPLSQRMDSHPKPLPTPQRTPGGDKCFSLLGLGSRGHSRRAEPFPIQCQEHSQGCQAHQSGCCQQEPLGHHGNSISSTCKGQNPLNAHLLASQPPSNPRESLGRSPQSSSWGGCSRKSLCEITAGSTPG